MADAQQLDRLRNIADWNAWRAANPDLMIDLSEADLATVTA